MADKETAPPRDGFEPTANSPGGTGHAATTSPSPDVARRVEILKRARAAFSGRDLDVLLPLISDDMELRTPGDALSGATTYSGKAGLRHLWEDLMEVIEDLQLEPLSSSAWRDYLIVSHRVTGRGKASGAEFAAEMTFIWRVRADQLVWGATFFSRSEGLEAIGATEDELELIE